MTYRHEPENSVPNEIFKELKRTRIALRSFEISTILAVQCCRNNRKKPSARKHLALIGPFERLGHGFVEVIDKAEDLVAQVFLG
jgi:hypothetical protein